MSIRFLAPVSLALCAAAFGRQTRSFEHSVRLAPSATHELVHTVAATGMLSVWAESESADLVLHAVRADGTESSDDDTGGGRTPWLRLSIAEAGERVTLRFEAKAGGVEGEARISLRELPESAASQRAFENANAALEEARALDAGGARLEAVEKLARAIDAYCADPASANCPSFHRTLMHMARQSSAWFDNASYLRASLARREGMRGLYPPYSEAWGEVLLSVCQGLLLGPDPRGAMSECERAMEVAETGYPPGHGNIAVTRLALAQAFLFSRDLERAEELMARSLDEAEHAPQRDETRLAIMRSELGALKMELGELTEALELHRSALATVEKLYAADHDTTLGIQNNLAATLSALGEKERALAIHEKRCAAYATRLPLEHPEHIAARMNRAITRLVLGDAARAAEELEQLVAAQERAGARAERDGDLLDVALGQAWLQTQRAEPALALLEARERFRAEKGRRDAVTSWRVGTTRAHALQALGRHTEALALAETCLGLAARAFPPENPDLAETRQFVAALRIRAGQPESARELALLAASEAQAYFARCATVLSMREAEAAQDHWSRLVSDGLTLLDATAVEASRAESDARAFELCESARAIGTSLLRATRQRARASPTIEQRLEPLRRDALRAARDVTEAGARSDDAAALDAALEARRRTEEALRGALARDLGLASALPRVDAAALARALRPDEALLAFWRCDARALGAGASTAREPRLLAFVVRSDGRVRRHDLGPLAPIAAAVEAWRAAVISGVAAERELSAGAALREQVLDPLRPALEGALAWRVALDDVLHSAALDALPETGEARLGDRVRILSVPSFARDANDPTSIRSDARRLVALGGVDYEAEREDAAPAEPRPAGAALARLGAGRPEFAPLWETQDEIDGVAALFRRFGAAAKGAPTDSASSARCTLLSEGDATKSALLASAAGATHLHIATHGFFGLEASSNSPRREALASRAPLSLCGLALAGANGGEDGAFEGLITADELALADLSRCELVVLSACDTNVGIASAGQGVASFQKALHAAGAKTVVTSLWKVDDAAARELMLAFYAALWSDGAEPQVALWRAKTALRARRAPARDWAGWVLSTQ
jgi:hypothetical protein